MKIGHIVNKIPLVRQNKQTNQLIDSTTLLGVEIEVEGYSPYDIYHSYAGYWTAKEDNSLRNNGMELVFAEPLSGADAITAITWLFDEAKAKKWRISKLTGAHVHMDARELELEQFKNFCAVFSLTEPLIYNWVGRGRFENMFCLPWYMAEGDLRTISKVAKEAEADPKRARQFLNDISKYSGLNINAIAKFGTVEFRMLETTFDTERFIDWLNILLSIKRYALRDRLTPEKMCQQIKAFGAHTFAQQVFGLELLTKMWYDDYQKDIISLGMTTCDWFLDNTRDLKLKGKSPAEVLNWSRIANLTEGVKSSKYEGEHAGLSKWKKKMAVPVTAKAKKMPLGIGDAFINAGNATTWQMINGQMQQPPPEPWPLEPTQIDNFFNDLENTDEEP